MHWEGIFWCVFRFALGTFHVFHVYHVYIGYLYCICIEIYVAMCIPRNVLIHAHWDIKVCVKVLGNVSACVLDYVLLHVYGYYILLHHVCMCICIGKWYEEKFLNLTKN